MSRLLKVLVPDACRIRKEGLLGARRTCDTGLRAVTFAVAACRVIFVLVGVRTGLGAMVRVFFGVGLGAGVDTLAGVGLLGARRTCDTGLRAGVLAGAACRVGFGLLDTVDLGGDEGLLAGRRACDEVLRAAGFAEDF